VSTARATTRALAGLLTAGLLTACGFEGVSSLPLPGAVAARGDTYRVTAEFEDVLDLVPYSSVKVQDATVGHVVEVRLVDGYAEVVCQLKSSVSLPANAVGRVAETSLLGEKYVSLDPPRDEPPVGVLADGGVVPLERTMAGATVEEVLGALSLVLNGGGVEQVRSIAVEVNAALTGREDGVRNALQQLDVFVGGIDDQKDDILRALEGVEQLSGTLAEQERIITDALQELPPALVVLRDQREALTEMLLALGRLGEVGTRVIEASRDDLLANLRDLQPVLTQLAVASEDIPKSLDVLATYPFARGVEDYFHGDYGNMWFTIDLYGPALARSFGLTGERPPPAPGLPEPVPEPPLPPPGAAPLPVPDLPAPPVPGLPEVPSPGVPDLPPVPSAPRAPSLPLPTVPREGGPSLPRVPIGSMSAASDIAAMLFGGLR
jgi:phospholipid/cholesterol/gamma-HCH transport system substrate-binding protein